MKRFIFYVPVAALFFSMAVMAEEIVRDTSTSQKKEFCKMIKECNIQSEKKVWKIAYTQPGGEYELHEYSAENFILKLTRKIDSARVLAQADQTLDRVTHTQNKIVFQCRISGKASVKIGVNLGLSDSDGKAFMKFGPSVIQEGGSVKKHIISLDNDFNLGDTRIRIAQLKLSAELLAGELGQSTSVEFSEIRLLTPEELGTSVGERTEVTIVPPAAHVVTPAADALKVAFSLDNDDYATKFGGRGIPVYQDRCQYPGFRDVLLETLRAQAVITQNIREADLIVYSRALAEPAEAAQIAEAVRAGTPLYVAGPVADPEIAALLPCKTEPLELTRLLPREKLIPLADEKELFDGLNKATFAKYFHVEAKPGSRVLLGGREPFIVEGKAGAGRVIYNALGLGVDLISGRTAYDAFFVRAASRLTGKKLPEEQRKTVEADREGFREGASEENFGRFGFALADGLLVEGMNQAMEVFNGSAGYRLRANGGSRIVLDRWSFKTIGSATPPKEISASELWHDIGIFELETETVIPEAWRNVPIQFAVEGGIDDTAEVFFNGHSIGKVTADMPEYWCRPHRYLVPSQWIHYGEKNQIRIVSENLRGSGGFGTIPILATGEKCALTFQPDRINALGKGGHVSDGKGLSMRFDTSLAFPGIRWESANSSMDLSMDNLAGFAAWKTKDNIVIADLKQSKTIAANAVEPWILFFKQEECRPLLVVFEQIPERVTVLSGGGAPEGVRLERKPQIGMILPIWLSGVASVDGSAWTRNLPPEIIRQIAFWLPKAFCYPISYRETFRIDRSARKVQIRTQYRYRKVSAPDGVAVEPFAPISPLAELTARWLVETEPLTSTGLCTHYGPLSLKEAADQVNWSLPLPEFELGVLPGMPDWLTDEANSHFRRSIAFMAGGSTRKEFWNFIHPTGKEDAEYHNISMHGWLHGLNQALTAPFGLDKDNFAALEARAVYRFAAPIEAYQYKAICRWREEPMSAIRYPIFFNNRHVHGSRYAAGSGSIMNYGDENETIHMILAVGQMLSDRHGQRDLIRANGNFFRRAVRLLMVSDDWAYLACHCRESGQNVSIDMLNCEYASMMKLARLAQILQDDGLEEQALYRAARRMVPTLGRFVFRDYVAKNHLLADLDNYSICVGYTELGGAFRNRGFIPNSIDLYDMSQGIPDDLIALYRRFLGNRNNGYFTEIVYPSIFQTKNLSLYSPAELNMIAQAGDLDAVRLRQLCSDYWTANRERLQKFTATDWPGMNYVTDFTQVLQCLKGPIRLNVAKDVEIQHFVFDPQTGRMRLRVFAGADAEMILQSSLPLLPNSIGFKLDASGRGRLPLKQLQVNEFDVLFKVDPNE